MNNDPMIRSITRLAVGLLIVGAAVAAGIGGPTSAAGFIGGGLVMTGSFLFGGMTAARLGELARAGHSSRASLLVALKLPVLGLSLWALFKHFEPIAVVAGGSIVIVSIVLATLLEPVRARKEA
jgi:hypothetical protein